MYFSSPIPILLFFSNLYFLVLPSPNIWLKTHNTLLSKVVVNHKHAATILQVKEFINLCCIRYVFNRKIQVISRQNTPILTELYRNDYRKVVHDPINSRIVSFRYLSYHPQLVSFLKNQQLRSIAPSSSYFLRFQIDPIQFPS